MIAARARFAVGVSTVALLPFAAACSDATDSLLEATDPDLVSPENAQSAEGALALYNGALGRLRGITAGDESTWLFGGLLADEWSTSSTFVQNDETDQRAVMINNSTVTNQFRRLARARQSATEAIRTMKEFREDETTEIAELYFVRAFAELQMASDFCNGIPLSQLEQDGTITFGAPRPVAEVFAAAIADADSGLALLSGTSSAVVAVQNALKITKARAQLGIAQYAAAATTVAGIPTSYAYNVTFAVGSGDNILWNQPASQRRYTVGDSLEGRGRNLLVRNAVPFFSLQDPRVPVSYTTRNNGRDTTISQDGLTPSRTTTLFARTTATPVVNGIDARLIEAEARLQADDFAGMTTILNALRAAPPKLGEVQPTVMGSLTAPTTEAAAIDLLFREKALWTFSRGQRLGDMRRLIRQYGRTANQVFPVGTHYRGGSYGGDVNLPVPQAEENNPSLDGPACIDRNA